MSRDRGGVARTALDDRVDELAVLHLGGLADREAVRLGLEPQADSRPDLLREIDQVAVVRGRRDRKVQRLVGRPRGLAEKTLKRLLLLAKKKYAYLRIDYAADGTLKPKPGDGIPSLSGLDGKRRDQTLLIADNFMDLVATLLDYHYDSETNLKRLRKLVWERMVTPVMNKTVNLRYLTCTKAVRKSAAQYTVNKAGASMSAPVHVQLFEKLVQRAGGANAAGAPQVGERVSYVIIKGRKDQKVSERGEDPIYVLDNSGTVEIDSRYYLDRHIKPSILRLIAPIINRGYARVGKNDRQALAQYKRRASEKMFGHVTDYNYAFKEEDAAFGDFVPATMAARLKKDSEKKTMRVSKKLLPTHDLRSGMLLRRPRLINTEIAERAEPVAAAIGKRRDPVQPAKAAAAAASKKKNGLLKAPPTVMQRTIAEYSAVGVRCKSCQKICYGRTDGYVCDECVARRPKPVADAFDASCRLLDDIEELGRERSALVDRCNDCVGCGDAPQPITCCNNSCPTFWDRQFNLRSLREAHRRLAVHDDVLQRAKALPAIDLRAHCYENDADDDRCDENDALYIKQYGVSATAALRVEYDERRDSKKKRRNGE